MLELYGCILIMSLSFLDNDAAFAHPIMLEIILKSPPLLTLQDPIRAE